MWQCLWTLCRSVFSSFRKFWLSICPVFRPLEFPQTAYKGAEVEPAVIDEAGEKAREGDLGAVLAQTG